MDDVTAALSTILYCFGCFCIDLYSVTWGQHFCFFCTLKKSKTGTFELCNNDRWSSHNCCRPSSAFTLKKKKERTNGRLWKWLMTPISSVLSGNHLNINMLERDENRFPLPQEKTVRCDMTVQIQETWLQKCISPSLFFNQSLPALYVSNTCVCNKK